MNTFIEDDIDDSIDIKNFQQLAQSILKIISKILIIFREIFKMKKKNKNIQTLSKT